MRAISRQVLLLVTVAVTAAALAPGASASIGSPAVRLTPATGTAAATANLGVDIKFSPTSGDTAKNLTLRLPAGLIANAALDNGACLKTTTPVSACQVGSGTVTATAAGLPLPLALNATFDLVAPPRPADLAGLLVQVDAPVTNQPTPLGSPAAVTLRPSGSAAGTGLDIAFSNIPNTFDGLPISLQEISSTFAGMRFPSSCPATPASLTVTADSYKDPIVQTGGAPLRITGCGSVPFAPAFQVTATRDAADAGVQIVTRVTQTDAQATTGTLALALPQAVVEPDAESVLRYNLICTHPGSGACHAIGTAVADSPLYPAPLIGSVYLTGQLLAPAVSIVFASPFPITLNGTLDLGTNTTTFTGVPDIPLTSLRVTLTGGPAAAFLSTCETPSGTATATLTSQNGDQMVTVPSAFTVADCVPPPTFVGSAGGSVKQSRRGRPAILVASVKGLATGRPTLTFTLAAGKGRPKIRWLTVTAPSGLRFITHRVHRHRRITGVSASHVRIGSRALHHGHLAITLRRAVARLRVRITHGALHESAALRRRVRHGRLKRLTLTLVVRDAHAHRSTLRLILRPRR